METHEFASLRLYHPAGAQVTFSFALPTDNGVLDLMSARQVYANVETLISAGFSVDAPGTEPGQKIEEIGFVSRRQKKDGTPIIDLYVPNERMIHRVFAHYLDNAEMVTEFEMATGLRLEELPVWEGDASMKRDNPNAHKWIKQTGKIAKIVLAPNPAYDANEQDKTKMKPQYKFVRWDGIAPAPPANVVGTITPANDFDTAFPPNTTPAPHWTSDAKKFFEWANQTYALSTPAVLTALNVKVITQFEGTKQEAKNAVIAYVDKKKATGS